MRIAFIVHDYNRSGGHSRYVAELASRFSREHDVHVFANTFDPADDTRVHFHRVPAWRINALTTILTFAVFSTLKRPKGFDIVHIQGFCGPRGNVVTTHACNEAWYRSIQRLAGGVRLRERINCLVTSALERRLYRKAHNCEVIAVSKRVGREVAELYGSQARIRTIYHGVNLQTFSPATCAQYRRDVRRGLGLAEHETAFLFVGNLRKGAEQCIRALAKLKTGTLLLASPSGKEAYQQLAEQSGCSDRVKWLGFTDRIEKFYAASDALLLPTPHDAFGLVVTEAMACGLPVVVSGEAGAAELIQHGVNGLTLDNFTDHEELAGHMQFLLDNREEAANLGRAARRTVEAFPWDSVADQTLAVYQQALAGS